MVSSIEKKRIDASKTEARTIRVCVCVCVLCMCVCVHLVIGYTDQWQSGNGGVLSFRRFFSSHASFSLLILISSLLISYGYLLEDSFSHVVVTVVVQQPLLFFFFFFLFDVVRNSPPLRVCLYRTAFLVKPLSSAHVTVYSFIIMDLKKKEHEKM